MEPTVILSYVMAIVSPITSAIIVFFVQRKYNNLDKLREKEYEDKNKDMEKTYAAQRRENILVLSTLNSIGKLAYANSIAIKEQKVNGVMDDALATYEKNRRDLSDFLREQAVSTFQNE